MSCLPRWPEIVGKHQDPGLRLFELSRPKLPVMRGRVLEIGYRDTPWAKWAKLADPSLDVHAIDWRKAMPQEGVTVTQGDILAQDYAPGSWDCIVGLSSFEHIGLGHYEGDPVHEDGDRRLVAKVREWLTPDGWCYFDVPYRPEGFLVKGSRYRAYDEAALQARFGQVQVLGYTTTSVDGWIEKPKSPSTTVKPYYYVACLLRA